MIIKGLVPPVFGVLITYLDRANDIAVLCHSVGARLVQLHGEIDREELKRLKTLDPTLTVIKSLVVGMRDGNTLEGMVADLSPFVDAFIALRRSFSAVAISAGEYSPAMGSHLYFVSRRRRGIPRQTAGFNPARRSIAVYWRYFLFFDSATAALGLASD